MVGCGGTGFYVELPWGFHCMLPCLRICTYSIHHVWSLQGLLAVCGDDVFQDCLKVVDT